MANCCELGFEVAQSSVAKYMAKRHGPPSQEWCTFLRNHAPDIAAMDLFVAPTIGFDLLYGLVIIPIAMPSNPDNVRPVREVAGMEIHQAYIGSSANPGYRDFAVAAEIVRGRTARASVPKQHRADCEILLRYCRYYLLRTRHRGS